MKPRYPEEELRRNLLTVRLKDREHKAICHHAWLNHQTASAYMRDIVLNYLETEDVDLSQDAGPIKAREIQNGNVLSSRN